MGMTGQELLEKYKKRRQGNNVSSEETKETTSTPLTGTQLLDNYNRKKQGLTTSTAEETTESSWDKYKEFANSEEGSQGWQKYLADQEASKQEVVAEEEDEKWWEKIGRWFGSGGAVDTSLPMGTTSQVIHSVRDTGLPDYTTPQDDWTDEQRNIYGYLYITKPDEASKYAEYLNTEFKEEEEIKEIQASATSSLGAGAAHTLGAIATAPLGLADFLNDLVLANAGVSNTQYDGIVSPFEYSQAVTGGVSEHLNEYGTIDESIPIIGGKGLGDLYGLGTSIAQSAVSGYTLGGVGTLVSYFGQGAASGVDDALSRGASEDQALLYGTVLGVAEGLAEQIGIDNLFKLGASPTVKVAIKNILKQAGAEGLEEGLTSVISNIADNAIMQDQSNFNAMVKAYMEQGMTEAKAKQKAWMDSIEGIAFDTLGGAISGGVHAGVHTGVKTAIDNHKVSQQYGNNQSIQDLLTDAVNTSGEAGNVADKLLAKYEKKGKLSGANLNELIYTTDTTKIKSAVEAKLAEYGETGDVSAIADVLVRQASGEKLSSKEVNILNQSKAGHLVSGELNRKNIKSGGLANDWAKDIGTKRINSDVYNRDLYDLATQMSAKNKTVETDSVAKTLAETANATEGKFKASEDGKTIYKGADGNSEEVSVSRIVSTDGELKVELDNGKTVSASDLSFSTSNEALMYEMVTRMEVTPDTANEIINTFKPTNTKQSSLYFANIPLAYQYGKIGYEAGLKNINLPEQQKRIAYNRGRIDAMSEAKSQPKGTATKKANSNEATSTKKNGIIFENFTYDEQSASDVQKASIAGIEVISKMSSLEVHVFESVLENGKRVYYLNGERKVAPNGYFRDGNKIYIDINAGNNGEGAMLYTMSHEVTHFIREWNAEGFKALGDFLIEEYGKQGVPVHALLEAQKDKIRKRYKRESTALPSEAKLSDMAYEELVCDAMSDMFADPKAYDKLAKFKKKNFKVWQKLGEAIKKLLNKLKSLIGIYSKYTPDADEAHYVRDFAPDVYEKLQDLYIKAFVEADTNYEASKGSKESVSKNEKTEKLSDRDLYSYETITSKPDMKITVLSGVVPNNRADVVAQAKKNAASLGKTNKDGSVSVHVDDIGADVILSTKGLRHGLRRVKNTETEANYIVTLKAGEILANSIRINELTPSDNNATGSYVLIGTARNESGDLYIVRSIVNHFNNELASMDVLYAINAKKESAALNAPRLTAEPLSVTDSFISISQLLDFVNRYFPDVLPESVLRHYGYDARPDGKIGEDALYSDRDSTYMDVVNRGDMDTAQKMVDEVAKKAGYTIKAYHGTARGDRVGNVFLPERATSGPMAFFTDNKDIADNYARNKADTSLAYDTEYDSYYTQFRVNRNGKNISIPELWKHLSFAERNSIKEKAKHIRFDDDYENIIVDSTAEHGNGAWDAYTLNMHRGNALEALVDTWLETGDLFNREADFIKVLEFVGISDVEYRNPDARYEKTYDTWLKIQKPFDTDNVNQSFYDSLSEWINNHDMSVYEKESSNADLWDKNNQSPESWLDKLSDDVENGTTHAWTVIPDFVTDYLKQQGYDGIKDKGGKGGGAGHTVWIPFSSEQIKSAEPITYDDNGNVIPLSKRFNSGNIDIRYSNRDSYAPTFYSYMGKVVDGIKIEKMGVNGVVSYLKGKGVKDEEIKWSGIEAFLEGKKSVTKAELQEFVAGSQLQIVEQMSGTASFIADDGNTYESVSAFKDAAYAVADKNGIDRSRVKFTIDTEYDMDAYAYVGNMNNTLLTAEVTSADGNLGRWSELKIDGGENYRELIFQLPNSSYSNYAMRTHWGEEAEGYRIEYDQDIPKFLRKYGKKWGATVGTAKTTEGYDVWSMDITDSMKDSVLNEGQVLYSYRDDLKEAKSTLKTKYKVEPSEVVTLADKYFNSYGGAMTKTEFTFHFVSIANKLAETFANGTYGSDATLNSALEEISTLAEEIASEPKDDGAMATELRDIKKYIRRINIEIPRYNKGDFDVAGGFENFRRKHFGKLNLSKVGINVDALYPELTGIFGEAWFPSAIESLPDQLLHIAEIVDTPLSAVAEVGYDVDEAKEYTQNSLYEEISEIIENSKKSQGSLHIDYRDTDSVSNRNLLANALESVAKNDIEKTKLTQYKQKIALIESEQKKLAEIRAKIKELSFAKGARDTEAIKKLQFEANQIANRINTYDKQLLNLESTKALKGVLEREKSMLRKRLEQKGKESLAAYREKAAKTQRELLTRYQEARKSAVEGRNKTAMRHKIKNVVSDLNKLLLNPTKEQHVPIGLQKVVADALDAINMDTMNAEERVKYYNDLISKSSDPDEIETLRRKRDFFEYRDMNFKDRITALKNAYAEFKESDDPLIRNAHNDAIADLIKNTADAVGNKSLKDMSLAQLEAVYDMYKAVLATVRNSNKMFKEGRQETVTENSEAVKVEVKEIGGHQERVLKATKFLKKAGWDMLKPVTAMKVIGSKTLAKLFDNVRAAEDTWAVDVREAKEFYEAISKKYGYNKWDFKTRYDFKDSRGEDFSISLEQMMSLYAYSKREQADEHLEFGGFIFDDAIEVTEKNKVGIPMKYEVNDANPHRLGQIQMMEIIGKLTQDQKAFIDEMQTYLSDVMGAKGNEVSLALYDIKLYKEKNYFPLKTARYFREFDPEKSGTPKIKNLGFSKKTVPQAGNPIVLSNFMDVWASHVNDMSMYHAFVLPLEDFMRVYNYSSTAGGYDSVQQYIKNAYGSQANQYIEKLMDDLNGGARVDPSAGIINKGLSLFKKASTFASASVVIQQPSSIARAFAYINPKYFATSAGSALNLKKHKEVWAEVRKYAPVAVIKEMGYFDTGMGRSTVEWIKGNQTIKDKMDDILSKAPAKADELSWSYIWLAVKKEIQATTDLTPGSEEFLKKAGERFTEIITNTQVYDSVLSRSGMMRSKDTGMKMATAFMAEPTTTVNMMVDGIMQGKRGNKKFLASTVGAVSASIILNAILVALVYAARDDDEDETYAEKYVGSLTTELLDGFNPLTYIPFVKDAWSIAQGYDVERSDMSVISNLWESIEGLFNEDKSGWEKVSDATGAVSSLFGIPLKNLIRDAKGMYNLTETLTSGTYTTGAGIGDAVEDALTSSIPLWDRLHDSDSKSDKLYEAIMSGDQTHISRIRSGYANEQAFESAMRQGLRENDSRIKEAAQARYEGNISEYTRIAKEIIREGNFSQDIVVGAINAELNAIKRGETVEEEPTEDKDEVTSIYSGSDINSAFDNGDYTLAQEIISDLIETKVANGIEEKNAKSSLRSSMTSYWKPLYKEAYQSGDTNEMARIRQILYSSGLYGSANEVVKTTQSWLRS